MMTNISIPTALVVDDNPRWLKTLERLVRTLGYDILIAKSYHQAIDQAKEYGSPLDLVVTDVRLEDNDVANIDGIRLLQELDNHNQLNACIIVTGYPNKIVERHSQQIGAEYLIKGRFTRGDFADAQIRITQRKMTNGNIPVDNESTIPSFMSLVRQFSTKNEFIRVYLFKIAANFTVKQHMLVIRHMLDQYQRVGGA